ncbi:MAG: hypothetical protein EHM45_07045 [Desulfobacteraceae bacterium]|nr:MAG: hypothetical protein EHM45_07045 [Desulfobacteraceae bacterium]
MRKSFLATLIGLNLFLLMNIPLQAAVIEAVSCSQQDVQAAIDLALDGDTVLIPSGTCEWSIPYGSSGSNWKAAVKIVKKSVILKGAGKDRTTIVNRVPYTWQNCAIHVEGEAGKPVRISGLSIGDLSTENASQFIIIDGDCDWRVDRCRFSVSANKYGGYRYIFMPYRYGLIDQCEFVNTLVSFKNSMDGVISWNKPLSLGTAAAVYVEDCTFYYGVEHGQLEDFIDGAGGARVVIRHNTVTNAIFHFHGIEGGSLRGMHSFELYENTVIGDGTVNNYRRGYMRGGTGVIFNNTWSGAWNAGASFYAVHQCVTIQQDPNDHRCDGDKWCHGYPCKDQIGRTSDADGDGRQDLAPLFAWNNSDGGMPVQLEVQTDYCPDCVNYIQEGRDYYNDTVRYDPATGFYTADYRGDDGKMKQWNYKPYVYPHPTRTTGPLADDALNIASPGRGVIWVRGFSRDITWSSSGVTEPVRIELYKGNDLDQVLARSVAVTSGTSTWQIPTDQTVGNDYTIKLTAGAHEGTSGNFSIVTPAAPDVTTDPATSVTQTSTVLRGSVHPMGFQTTYCFEYGLTTAYGTTTPGATLNADTDETAVQVAISALEASTTYHFRLVATNSAGTSPGEDRTFTTTASGGGGGGSGDAAGGGGGGGGCFMSVMWNSYCWRGLLGLAAMGLVWKVRKRPTGSRCRG